MATDPLSQNATRVTRITHLSDLHLPPNPDFLEGANILALTKDVCLGKPDIIVVTGDLIDNHLVSRLKFNSVKKSMDIARRFLLKLCEDCELEPAERLFVVPGNHDYRLWGALSKTSKKSKDKFEYILGDFFRSLAIQGLNVEIYCFDSNASKKAYFAAGSVERKQLLTVFDSLTQVRDHSRDEDTFRHSQYTDSPTRIAVLHHHPMPIVNAQADSVSDSEQFHLLLNAGIVMKEMAKNGIDIILHGHRHHPGYSRAGLPLEGEGIRYVGVIGAGTATQVSPYPSYNRIYVEDGGSIFAEYRCLRGNNFERMQEPVSLLTEQEIRQNRRDKLCSTEGYHVGVKVDAIIARTSISRIGDAVWNYEWIGVRSYSGEPVSSIPFEIELSSSVSRRGGFLIKSSSKQHRVSMEENKICFKPALTGTRVDFEITFGSGNAFFFDERDLIACNKKEGIADNDEYVSLTVLQDFTSASIVAEFPKGFVPQNPRVEVHQELLYGYHKTDEREEKCMNRLMLNLPESNVVTLSISDPMPRYRYALRWSLPVSSRLKELSPIERGRVESLRHILTNVSDELFKMISDGMGQLRERIVESSYFNITKNDDLFHIMLLGFDDQQRCLKLAGQTVCRNGHYVTRHKARTKTWFMGEDVVGQALKEQEVVICSSFEDTDGKVVGYDTSLVCERSGETDLKIECAIPLRYPIDSERGPVVGVMAFASCSNRCGLHEMLYASHDAFSDEVINRDGLSDLHTLCYNHFFHKIAELINFPR